LKGTPRFKDLEDMQRHHEVLERWTDARRNCGGDE
jgi:hypothetical protein